MGGPDGGWSLPPWPKCLIRYTRLLWLHHCQRASGTLPGPEPLPAAATPLPTMRPGGSVG
eukprot:12905500-Prorocentrum_lima.AAC.1